MDAIITLSGYLFYLLASFISMALAEKDYHLLYLTDKEEEEHFFFRISRAQCIVSQITSSFYLMHGIFCIDLLMMRPDIHEYAPMKASRYSYNLFLQFKLIIDAQH